MVKVIALDLDNTLVKSDKTISPYTMDVLARCQQKGILIAYATARSKESASFATKQFAPDYFIGYSGAMTLDSKNTIIDKVEISSQLSSHLLSTCLAAKEISYIYAIGTAAAITNNQSVLKLAEFSHYSFSSFAASPTQSYLKISVDCPNTAIIRQIAQSFPTLNMVKFRGEILHQFTNKDATKWNALSALAKHLHLSTNDFISFGDDQGDVEMLQNCGIGVAMQNAVPKAQAAANYICDTNDNDGVAKWIDEHVL